MIPIASFVLQTALYSLQPEVFISIGHKVFIWFISSRYKDQQPIVLNANGTYWIAVMVKYKIGNWNYSICWQKFLNVHFHRKIYWKWENFAFRTFNRKLKMLQLFSHNIYFFVKYIWRIFNCTAKLLIQNTWEFYNMFFQFLLTTKYKSF